MHHMTRLKMMRQYAKAKENGFYKPPPPTQEEQARLVQQVNKMIIDRGLKLPLMLL